MYKESDEFGYSTVKNVKVETLPNIPAVDPTISADRNEQKMTNYVNQVQNALTSYSKNTNPYSIHGFKQQVNANDWAQANQPTYDLESQRILIELRKLEDARKNKKDLELYNQRRGLAKGFANSMKEQKSSEDLIKETLAKVQLEHRMNRREKRELNAQQLQTLYGNKING